ncbi:hypothetical protein B0O99DRAFT_178594 [Bisporella sp. PMI_857]|nr:hypothetical protein B0O99DRAFT_178594 [Bisporella sp. PMI_857]
MEPPISELFGNLKFSPQLPPTMNVPDICVSSSTPGNDVYGSYLLSCNHSDCHGRRSFTNKQALKKHMERHTRPYPCLVSGCTVNSFGTKGDLQRHHRQVHERHQFRCPVYSCDRHNQGFGRKDNLREHLRRMHSLHDNGSDALEMDDGAIKDTSLTSAPEIIPDVRSDQPHPVRPPLKAELEAELIKLEATKAEMERDIEALKRVLQMM